VSKELGVHHSVKKVPASSFPHVAQSWRAHAGGIFNFTLGVLPGEPRREQVFLRTENIVGKIDNHGLS
jgi:hypothetical protein